MAATLTAGDITRSSAALTLAGHTAAWWYQGSQSNASCTPVTADTATVSLASLTANTSYTYKAYGASGCDSGDELASETFRSLATTVPAAPVKPTVTGGNARVTLTWTAPDDGGAAITR